MQARGPLMMEHRKTMDELIADHVFSRNTTKLLVDASLRYRSGSSETPGEVTDCLKTFVDFYPANIKMEDDAFFPVFRAYFTQEEDQAMLAEFWDFDRKMIHEKYKSVFGEFAAK